MELLDRYLQAVKKHLPWQRQDDILAELRANLESQLEDKEAELGRPLTKAEAEAWLKQIGAPMQVAARYQPQQYLIGPSLFPIYLYVLKFASLLALLVYSVVSAVLIFASADPNLTSVIGAILRHPRRSAQHRILDHLRLRLHRVRDHPLRDKLAARRQIPPLARLRSKLDTQRPSPRR